MKITAIAALDQMNGLGKNGDLLFKNSGDLKMFKEFTMGKLLVMGRKTFESLPPKGLPGRTILVVSRNEPNGDVAQETGHQGVKEGVHWLSGRNLEWIDVLNWANHQYGVLHDSHELVVAGGAEIYEMMRPVISVFTVNRFDEIIEDADTALDEDFFKGWSKSESTANPDFVTQRYANKGAVYPGRIRFEYSGLRVLDEEQIYTVISIPRHKIDALELRRRGDTKMEVVLLVGGHEIQTKIFYKSRGDFERLMREFNDWADPHGVCCDPQTLNTEILFEPDAEKEHA